MMSVLCTKTGSYNYRLRGTTVLGCTKQIRSATPLEVKLVELKGDKTKLTEKGEETSEFELDEEEVPSVDLPEGLSHEQRNYVKEMLGRAKDVFRKKR